MLRVKMNKNMRSGLTFFGDFSSQVVFTLDIFSMAVGRVNLQKLTFTNERPVWKADCKCGLQAQIIKLFIEVYFERGR